MERAEFDRFADEYDQQHRKNIALTGEEPAFFAEYKIADLAAIIHARQVAVRRIVDFGSGIGNSVPHFRKHLPDAAIVCADVSARSLELAQRRFPGQEEQAVIGDTGIPIADSVADVAFSACVFHHIDHAEHHRWLQELHRVTRPGGLLVIFEHNPRNPLTVRAVDTCPFDANARLITAQNLKRAVRVAGWNHVEIRYRIFFPRMLARLRPLERLLTRVMLGAQYCVIASRP